MGSVPAAIIGLGLFTSAAHGQVLFSVRDAGPSGLEPRFIYERTGLGPNLVGGGPGMRLFSPMDQLDDFGGVIPEGPDVSTLRFIMCYSVDRMSSGAAPPALRGGPLPPFNVFDQALKGQHAGDVFGGTEAYDRTLGRLPAGPGGPSLGLFNNVLLRNQSRQYFIDKDFDLLPLADPVVSLPPGTPIDDVDGSGMRAPSGQLPATYFSLSSASPSLTLLGGDSGADVFLDLDITTPGSETLFASSEQLGLLRQDDIDGLSVCDDNVNGHFDGTDQILFSLKPGSPTLTLLGASPADVFSVRVDAPGLQVFETALNLGLLPTDNIDTLKMDPLLGDSALFTLTSKLPAPSTVFVGFASLLPAVRRRR